MNVKALKENGVYELYDQNGMLIKGGFKDETEVKLFCKQSGYILTDIFKIVLTNTL